LVPKFFGFELREIVLLKQMSNMKKQLLVILALLGGGLNVRGQKADTARVLIHYKFTHVTDLSDPAHPYTENMALLVGKTASVYKSYDGMVADEQFRDAYIKATANSPDGRVSVDRSGASMRAQYFQYPNAQKLLTKDFLMFTEYLIDGPMPAIDWKISGDTSTFGGLHCQKATGHFKGRDYVAWFCPDLPVRTGPWKLNGLPGVIVDARDTKNEVIFQFDGVEKPVFAELKPIAGTGDVPPILRGLDDNPNLIVPPARAIKATQQQYDKLKDGTQKNPNAIGQGQAAIGGAGGGDQVLKALPGGPARNVNPIELPEKP
jgi:GLPGLI family protein